MDNNQEIATPAQKPQASFEWISFIWHILSPYIWKAFFLSLFIAVCSVGLIGLLTLIYDNALYAKANSNHLLFGGLATGAFVFILRFIRAKALSLIGMKVDISIKSKVIDKIISLSPNLINQKGAGYFANVFAEMQSLHNVLKSSYLNLIFDLPFILIILGFTAIFSLQAFLVMLGICVVFLATFYFNKEISSGILNKEKLAAFFRNETITNFITNLPLIKMLSIKDGVKRNLHADDKLLTEKHFAHYFINQIFFAFLSVFGLLALLFIAYLQTLSITAGASIGSAVVTILLAAYLIYFLLRYSKLTNLQYALSMSLARLNDLLSYDDVRSNSLRSLIPYKPKTKLSLSEVSLPSENERKIFDNVSFEFTPGSVYILKNSFDNSSESLIQILLGFIRPEGGKIWLGDVNITEYSEAEIAKWVRYIPPFPLITNDSVKMNLELLPRPKGNMEGGLDYLEAAELFGLDSFIESLPEGYNTNVGKAALTFAQKNLISLVRSFVGNPNVVLIDNFNFNFDEQTEKKVMQAIAKMSESKIIIASVPPKTFADMTPKVITIEDGKIASSLAEALPQAVAKLSEKIASVKGKTENEPRAQNAVFRRIKLDD